MADVEMSDAPAAAKKADGTVAKVFDGKKKFEVKKVRPVPDRCWMEPC